MSYHMEVSNRISYYSMISSIQVVVHVQSDSKENLLVPDMDNFASHRRHSRV